MADNVVLDTPGTPGATAATIEISHSGDTAQLQMVGLMGVTGTEGAYTVAEINGDATNGLDVDVTRVIPGTTATALGKAEDAAHTSGDTGVMMLGVRNDTRGAIAGADGDYTPPQMNASGDTRTELSSIAGTAPDTNSGNKSAGTLRVVIATDQPALTNKLLVTPDLPAGAATAAKQPALGTAGTASADVITVQGVASMTPLDVNIASGGVPGFAEDAAAASGDTGVVVLAVRQDSIASSTSTDGDYGTLKTNNVGRLYTSATVDAALPAGTNNIGDVDVLTLPNVTLAAGTNTNEVVGDAAHDAAISGNPVRIAGRALTSDYTAVAAGDTADLITTLLGKLVVIPYANPANTWSYAAASGGITNTTGVTAKAAAGAGVRIYITHASVINGHATVDTDVQIRDGASGTVLWRGFAKAAGGGVSERFDPPLRGTANTLVEIANGTTGSATYFNLQGFTAAE